MKLIQIGLLASVLSLTGCASIVSKAKWPVSFKSDPPGAQLTISDENGKTVRQGVTPTTIKLASGNGYFKAQNYQVNMKLDGYKEDKGILQAGLNGWYFGNIGFGGLIGMLAVDPATGAMWRLPKEYSATLSKVETPATPVSLESPQNPAKPTPNPAPPVSDNRTNSVSQR
ncbi:MAG: hypothetical protein ABSE16_00025 [Verrucomicrobiota bacterium]|jgi:hypothetical protein